MAFLRLAAALAAVLALAAGASAADGILYGLSPQMALITIDPVTGAIGNDTKPLPDELQAQNLATVDIERGIFYTLGYNDSSQIVSLIGFDKEGKLTCNWPLPFVTSAFVGVGEAVDVDSTNGEVFCMGLKADGKHHLYRVNPRTGALRYLSECGYVNVLGGAHAFDIANNEVWLQYGLNKSGDISIDFFVFDAFSGKQKKMVKMDPANVLATLSYDVKAKKLVGFGIDTTATPTARTVVQLDPIFNTYKKIATLENYFIDNGGIATINTRDRVLYGQLQKAGANQTSPFELVAVNLDTGSVVSAPKLCDSSPDCPWSMEFVPTRR